MSDCPDNLKNQYPPAFWESMMKMPALRYMKAPVDTEAELYDRYKIGNEKGTFAYVYNENSFYAYHPYGILRGKWKPVGGGLSSLFEIMEADLLKEGDMLVWDLEKKKFVVVNMSLWATEEY